MTVHALCLFMPSVCSCPVFVHALCLTVHLWCLTVQQGGAESLEQRTHNGEVIPDNQPLLMTGGVLRPYQMEGYMWLRVRCGSFHSANVRTGLVRVFQCKKYKLYGCSGSELNLFTGVEEVLFPVISYLNLALMWFGTGAYVWIGAVWDIER